MDYYNKLYWECKLEMLMKALVFIGALNWGATIYGYNLVSISSDYLNNLLCTDYAFDKMVYVLVTIIALYLIFKRDTWLPFLGTSVLPGNIVALKKPEHFNMKITVNVKPNSKIIYWAALGKDKKDQNVEDAYYTYNNSGVVMSDEHGNADLHILEGNGYDTPLKHIERHIHYRVFYSHGMVGPVKTIFY